MSFCIVCLDYLLAISPLISAMYYYYIARRMIREMKIKMVLLM